MQYRSITQSVFCILLCLSVVVYIFPVIHHDSPENGNVEGWDVNSSRSLPLYLFPEKETVILADYSIALKPLLLLVVVCSKVSHFRERAAIRKTWGNYSSAEYRTIFLLGQTKDAVLQEFVEMEFQLRRDIIQEDFIDSYNNLTLKSAMLLKQITSHFQNVKYIFKCDDDTFIHMPHLLALIQQLEETKSRETLVGGIISEAVPVKNALSKWYVPKYLFDGDMYPNYLSGSGYLMDKFAAAKLYNATLVTPFFHMEDIFITGMCAKEAKLKLTDHSGFYLDSCLDTTYNHIIVHRIDPDVMSQLWIDFPNGLPCDKSWF